MSPLACRGLRAAGAGALLLAACGPKDRLPTQGTGGDAAPAAGAPPVAAAAVAVAPAPPAGRPREVVNPDAQTAVLLYYTLRDSGSGTTLGQVKVE